MPPMSATDAPPTVSAVATLERSPTRDGATDDVDALIAVVRSFNDGLIIQRVMLGADLAPIHTFIWEHVLSPLKLEP